MNMDKYNMTIKDYLIALAVAVAVGLVLIG